MRKFVFYMIIILADKKYNMKIYSYRRFCSIIVLFMYTSPVMSASTHPIGMDTHMPVSPMKADSIYASTTLRPSDITVSTSDMPGRFTAL